MLKPLEIIRPIIERKVNDLGFELFDIKLIRAGSHSVLRIAIDKEGGPTIGNCETVSNEVSVLLDVEEFSDHPYAIEVSTPGIDRPLLTEKDFLRNVGRTVELFLKEELGGKKNAIGVIASVANGTLELTMPKQSASIAIGSILSGKIIVQFK